MLTKIMGVLNVTPNSFSDGGCYINVDEALIAAQKMIAEGADWIDVGGEASNPGAKPISLQEELDRVMPVILRLRAETDVQLSIDTYKPGVMKEAVRAGVGLINDIKALQEPGALEAASMLKAQVCLMHMQGTPMSMQSAPYYEGSVVDAVHAFFKARIDACLNAGIDLARLWIDPGIGFGKTLQHNIDLLKALAAFHEHKVPIMLGVSRKSVLGALVDKPVDERVIAGSAVAMFAAGQGIQMIRTHDVDATRQVLKILDVLTLD